MVEGDGVPKGMVPQLTGRNTVQFVANPVIVARNAIRVSLNDKLQHSAWETLYRSSSTVTGTGLETMSNTGERAWARSTNSLRVSSGTSPFTLKFTWMFL